MPDPDRVVPPLRVELVTGTLQIGGAETQLVRLAQVLADAGHEVRVAALLGGGPLESDLSDAGIPVHVARLERRHRAGMLRSACELVSFCWAVVGWRPDVVQARLPIPRMVAMPLAFVTGVPVRVANRVELWPGASLRRPWQRRAHAVATRCTSVVAANSKATAADACSSEGVTSAKVRVLPNGLDLPDRVASPGWSPAEGVVVANLTRVKAHRDLIDALALLDSAPVVHLVGDGPERTSLEQQVDQAGLRDRVLFEGSVTSGATRFADGQFALLTSHAEGMPNAVLEAMSYGLPVIATSVGGIPELVDESNGILVEPGHPKDLAAAIERIATDPELRSRLGAASRRRAEGYSWDECRHRHEQLYAEVLRRTARGRRRMRRAGAGG